MSAPKLTLDFFADFTCPWCYVGFHALQQARQRAAPLTDLHWRPYLLRPDTPAEGLDRAAFYRSLEAADPQRFAASTEALAQIVADLGLPPLERSKPDRLPNMINAQRLMFWAGPAGVQEALAARLFNAYWRDGENLGDAGVLVDLAAASGMNRDVLIGLFQGDADRDRVLELHRMAQGIGITGVPVVIRDGKTGVMGAQSVDAYVAFLNAP